MFRALLLTLPLALLACNPDKDGDGYGKHEDCNDAAAGVYPTADETCNGVDDDCDGEIDEDATDAQTWYRDGDQDGQGDPLEEVWACEAPEGYVSSAEDCDDTEPTVSLGGTEVCDGLDNDCDGEVDEDAEDALPWYLDADGDGFGAGDPVLACEPPADHVDNDQDCDDDAVAAFPGGTELCDGLDNDCDGTVDVDAVDAGAWYDDVDEDGYGALDTEVFACTPPDGWVEDATDCDDASAAAHPGADEVCDGADNDCDGDADEAGATDAPTWYLDFDDDGYGSPRLTVDACVAPAGYVDNADDCDDTSDQALPGGSEVCDGLDNDCNLLVDDGASDAVVFYRDTDGDGYGATASSLAACEAPPGYADNALDCSDVSADVSPAATETCNGRDDDCDGAVDEDDAADASTWYMDLDADGYGTPLYHTAACDQPAGYVPTGDDCDDLAAEVNPGVDELCNTVDDDCDGTVDEDDAVDAPTWFRDGDGDGVGTDAITEVMCSSPVGFVPTGGDCDDADATRFPGNPDVCDGEDNDCSGVADDDLDYLGSAASCPAASCAEAADLHSSLPESGVYFLQGASSTYRAWCDHDLEGGGWTLLGVFTNEDGVDSWGAHDMAWVSASAFGAWYDPTTNEDAKSPAYSEVDVDQVMVVRYPDTVYALTSAGCIGGDTLQSLMSQDSQSDADCAHSCPADILAWPWDGQAYQTLSVQFRCMDNQCSELHHGYIQSCDDNSMITSLDNTNNSFNFGLGAGESRGGGLGGGSDDFADWDRTTADYADRGDRTQILLYGR